MSDSVPSRTDAVVPEKQAAAGDRSTGSISTAPASRIASAEMIERMQERLSFYETFDEIIQQNIARSGQLMREAGEKREEAVATIAQSRRQIETERETQRASLTELLDDVMTIQQATERLAHRVADALEQVEFELEPIGLHGNGVLGGQHAGRLPAQFASERDGLRSVAEDVHDEYRLGVLGQSRPEQTSISSSPVQGGLGSFASGPAAATSGQAYGPAPEVPAGAPAAGDGARVGNPENVELQADEPELHDATEAGGQVDDDQLEHEPDPGQGVEAAPVEANAGTWETSPKPEDMTTMVEPYAEARIETHAEQIEPEGDRHSPAVQLVSDASDEVPEGETNADDSPATQPVGAGSTRSFGTAPVSANLTGPDVLAPDEAPVPAIDAGPDIEATDRTDGIDAEVSVVGADAESDAPPVSPAVPETTSRPTLPGATEAEADDAENEPSHSGAETPNLSATTDVAPSGSAVNQQTTEQQTTVVLDGVPRAAVALAIQRHILSKPDVLRAEVREYYDHRLTLFVTGRRATTAGDLEDWDGSATWEQVQTTPELLELRMTM